MRLLLYPTHTLPTAAAPVLVGVGLALHDGVFSFWPAFLGFVGSWLIHVGGVFNDNLELLRRHRHVLEHPELLAALERGELRLGQLRVATIACFVLGVLPAPYLVARGGWPIAAVGAAGILASYGYAGSGIAYARRGLADFVFLLMFGVVGVAATYFVQAGRLPLEACVVGLPVGALIVCVLVIDDIRDRAFDRDKGWRTPTVRLGLRFSRLEFSVLMVSAYLALPVLWLAFATTPFVLLPLLTLPLALPILGAVLRFDRTADLLVMTPRTATLSFLFAALLGVGLWP